MDPDVADVDGLSAEAAEDISPETRQPEAVALTTGHLRQVHDGHGVSSAVDPEESVTGQWKSESTIVGEGTARSAAETADDDVVAEKLPPGDNAPEDDYHVQAGEMAAVDAAGASTSPDMAQLPTLNSGAASLQDSSAPASTTSVSSQGGGGETDEEERRSTEDNQNGQAEPHSSPNEVDHSTDLPSKLHRLWGTSPPDRAEGLAVLRNMLGYRIELDGILSRHMPTKGSRYTRPFHGNDYRASSPFSNPRPFTLATLAGRFAPTVTNPSELRERVGTRVRVVTAAGLRVGLARRVFAREPLLPSDVEAEEERQSRQQPDASPAPVDVEDLRALVVPVRASASSAPEMSPEGGPAPYPSMVEVSSVMWCDYDEDDEDGGGDGGRRRTSAESSPGEKRLLRVSVQTLDGDVCDDEDEDSESDDGDSETDVESDVETDFGETEEGSFFDTASSQQRRESTGARGSAAGRSRGGDLSEGGRGNAKGARRTSGVRNSKAREEELDEIGYQRKEELASVLRRLRVAIRRMDGTWTEEKVRSMAKRVVRVAVMMASKSELVTTTAARGALRGLGDRTRLRRQQAQRGGAGSGDVGWVTVYVGVGRWGPNFFGPGFAVETQEKYRLGWLSLSSQPAARMMGGGGMMAGGGASGNAPASEQRRAGGARVRRGGWAGRRSFFGLGRRTNSQRREWQDDDEAGIEGWVGSLTCNYCEGHPLGDIPTARACGEQHGIAFKTADNGIRNFPVEQHATSTAVPVTISEEEEGDEVFSEARGTPVTVAESGNDDDRTPQEIAAALGSMRTPPNSTPAREVIGGSLQVGSGDAVKEEEEEQEEWCKGHVCLRLRPDGLRERRRGSASGAGMGLGGDAEEGSEDESGSDTDPAAGSDGENLEDLDDIDIEGVSSSTMRELPSEGNGRTNRGSRGVRLSSITKSLFEGERRNSADPCGVSSEKSSKSLEVFAWGDNAGGCLGLPADTSAGLLPRVLQPFGLLPGERVVAVCCSERHSLLVTGMGSVYSAGDGTDGALGVRGRESSDEFRLVEWFAEQMPPPKVCQASAGSDLIGCHSAALDADGRLFTWGVGAATGHASLKPVLLPREMETLGGFGTGSEARDADGRPAGLRSRVKGVSCGGGFTLAVTNGGKVFAWGSWARGRLGLGRPPERTIGRKKKVPRFQGMPRKVSGLGRSPVVQVSAGAWHGMALTEDGEVFTWGHNASGQLGFLVTPSPVSQRRQQQQHPASTHTPTAATSTTSLSEMLRASWTPVKLPAFGKASEPREKPQRAPAADEVLPGLGREESLLRKIVHIACGPEHSIAIDSGGAAWTWGAEGRACLGHGEAGFGAPGGGTAVAAEAQARAMGLAGEGCGADNRQTQPFIPLSREREVSRARARRALVGGWAVPREIASLASPSPPPKATASNTHNTGEGTGRVKVVSAACGFSHTTFVTQDGRMYLFGEGAAVAGGDLQALKGENGGVVEGAGLREAGGLVRRRRSEGGEDHGGLDAVAALSAVAGPTPVPREACSSWFPTLAARRVAAVACGGQHVFALLAGDRIGYTLGMDLFRTAMGTDRHLPGDPASPERGVLRSGEGSVDGDGEGAVGWARGGVDCELLVAGSYLHAHRVVLARRSPVLRDMIAQEERPAISGDDGDDDGLTPPLQLLLPDIRFDVARALLEFLYTGELRRSLDLNSPLPYDLRAAAKSYGVSRLEALCREAISLGADPGEDGADAGWGEAVPPPSLAGDLGEALGTMEHADVKFVAGGRPIYAHRVVLSCQSEYFAAMFRFRDQMRRGAADTSSGRDEHGGHSTAMAEIVVPDSYAGFVRLLLFLYTGVLPDANPESVLEDLVCADRYRLLGMKRVSQSMVRLAAGSCLQALEAAETVNAPLLRQAALFHVEHNLYQVSQQKGFPEIISGTPGVAKVLLSRLHATAANASAVSSAAARQKRLYARSREQRVEADGHGKPKGLVEDGGDPSFRADSPFPWGAALVAVACGTIYYKVSNVVAVGMFVPVVNGVFLVCLAAFAFHKLRDKGLFEGGREKKIRRRQQLQQGRGRVVRKRGGWRERRREAAGGSGRGGSTYLFG